MPGAFSPSASFQIFRQLSQMSKTCESNARCLWCLKGRLRRPIQATRHITKSTTPPAIPPTIGATFDAFRGIDDAVVAIVLVVKESAGAVFDDEEMVEGVIVLLMSSSVV